MTLLYYDPKFLEHDTGAHPERPRRLAEIVKHLEESNLTARCECPEWQSATRARLLRVHTPAHLETLEAVSRRGGGALDPDTIASAASFEVARLAAGAACDAVGRVLSGKDKSALCLLRPPGHHALANRAMGFCLLNNIAIAARAATDEYGLDRVLVVDWDVHHGNGTQDLFYNDGRVGFLSIHRWPFYPGTGAADESGTGDGLGATHNVPVEFGTPRDQYRELFRGALETFADRLRPQLVLVSAGFDSHREDPIGSLGLEVEDFADLTAVVRQVAATHAEGRVVSLLEGGYNPPVLAQCVATHLEGLLAEPN